MPIGKRLCQPTRLIKRCNVNRKCHGFAYVLLLITVSVISIFASASVSLGSQVARRDAEHNLLSIGSEFEQALRAYAAVPAGAITAANARGPRNLEELLKDARSASTRRYLRQVYAYPLTGQEAWGTVKDSSGFIVRIYSLADGKPIKRTGFPVQQAGFEDADTYSA